MLRPLPSTLPHFARGGYRHLAHRSTAAKRPSESPRRFRGLYDPSLPSAPSKARVLLTWISWAGEIGLGVFSHGGLRRAEPGCAPARVAG